MGALPLLAKKRKDPLFIFGPGLAAYWPIKGAVLDATSAPPDDAENVETVQDKSGNGFDMVHATEANQADYQVGTANGQPSIHFDRVDDYYLGSQFTIATSGIAWAVVQLDADMAGTGNIMACSDTAGGNDYWQWMVVATTEVLRVNSTIGASPDIVDSVGTLSLGVPHICILISNGTAWRWRIDGVEQSLSVIAGSNSGQWPGDNAAIDNGSIGAGVRSTVVSFFQDHILNAGIADGEPTVLQVAELETFLANLFGVSI